MPSRVLGVESPPEVFFQFRITELDRQMNRSDLALRSDDFVPSLSRRGDVVSVYTAGWRQGGHGHLTVQHAFVRELLGLIVPEKPEPFLLLADLNKCVH